MKVLWKKAPIWSGDNLNDEYGVSTINLYECQNWGTLIFENTNCIWYISFKCKFLIFFNVMISTLFYLTFKEYELRYFKVVLFERINWKDWSLWLNINVWKKRTTIKYSIIPFLWSTHHILKVHKYFSVHWVLEANKDISLAKYLNLQTNTCSK